MVKIGLFLDISNLYFTIRKKHGKKLNYSALINSLDGEMICAFAYGAQTDGEADNFINFLQNLGIYTKFKKPRLIAKDVRKANWDVGLTVDVIHHLDKLDVVIIGTSDGDFFPLVQYCSKHGKKVEIIGSNISSIYRHSDANVKEIGEDLLI